jgi:hypothetical protein
MGHESNRQSSPAVRRALWLTLAFQGVTAVGGGAGLVADPSGELISIPQQWLRGSPFSDYLVPGLILLTVLGIGPLIVAAAVQRRRPWAKSAAFVVGVVLAGWLGIEILTIGYQPNPPLQLIYAIVAVAITALALAM